MVQLGLKDDFSGQVLEWDETVVPMTYPDNFLAHPDLTKRKVQEVVMHTAELASTIEANERVVK